MRTLISNGIVVNADGSCRADVLVEDETITAVGLPEGAAPTDQPLPVLAPGEVDRIIDARGRLVIPGGVDPHTHMELPVAGTVSRDTFETGSRAAAFGGTTTIIDFAGQTRGRPLREGLEAWMSRAEGRCAIDYGFHMMVNDVSDATLAEMDSLVAEGITTFKLFTAYPGVQLSDDGAILRAMLRTAENDGLILMHAENGVAIDVIANVNAEAGRTDPWYHGLSRHPGLEAECVQRVIRLAEVAQVPVYIVHLSSRDALEEVVRGRQRGARVIAETCPQYLALSIDDLGNGFEGAKFVCSPPLRPRDHQEALWQGLANDDLQVVGTDHCPFDFAGQKDLGRGDFRKIPNGLPGVEERLDPPLPGGRGGPSERGALGRGLLDRGGADLRPGRHEGCHRPRLRCRHRHLRPRATPRPVGRDAPHGRRLLVLRGPRGTGWQRHRAVAWAGHRRGWRVPGPPG